MGKSKNRSGNPPNLVNFFDHSMGKLLGQKEPNSTQKSELLQKQQKVA